MSYIEAGIVSRNEHGFEYPLGDYRYAFPWKHNPSQPEGLLPGIQIQRGIMVFRRDEFKNFPDDMTLTGETLGSLMRGAFRMRIPRGFQIVAGRNMYQIGVVEGTAAVLLRKFLEANPGTSLTLREESSIYPNDAVWLNSAVARAPITIRERVRRTKAIAIAQVTGKSRSIDWEAFVREKSVAVAVDHDADTVRR